MPVIRVETNITLQNEIKKAFTSKFSSFASEILGKPESVMMVIIIDSAEMCFSANHEPSAYIELKSVGLLPESCGELSEKICAFVEKELGAKPERTYIEYKNLDPKMFGWNSRALA
jgi:phenylpyruvate tautomerase PptA (4-oxalocrotonate tautomerase family)